ncbi:MAG TPA: ScbA/BarX family gamma-butyrolactone biosynthesis protein [Amycolatopsis sp.]|nr:ScbA/BarX family gamma-butyrolactone biosynthesis protein [Amycolatopsis sp.]
MTVISPDPAGNTLSFASCVPCQLVHRRAVAEVLITDWRAVGEHTFECAAQWPRGHRLYRVREGRHDPLLVAETLRQAGIMLCHVAYDIPADHSFLMDRLAFEVDPGGLAAGRTPADVVVRIEVTPGRRTKAQSSLRFDMAFLRDGRPVATGVGVVRCVAPALYRRLRAQAAEPGTQPPGIPEPVGAATVGLIDPGDVVIGHQRPQGIWPVRVPVEHPVLFDHPLDHVPGMLVFEALRQAARVQLGWAQAQPLSADLTFGRFLELTDGCSVRTDVADGGTHEATLAVCAEQASQVAAEGTMTLARHIGA